MQALILAAGSGTRMADYEGSKPKCLYEVGGRPLIAHQLDALSQAGIDSVVIVVGYRANQVRGMVNGQATYVHNEEYAYTNSLYSFVLGGNRIEDDVLVLNSDVLLPPALVEYMATTPGNAFAYDSGSGDEAEHMKVRLRDGHLLEMAKQLPPAHTHGENLGLIRFERQALRYALEAGRVLISRGRRWDWLASAVNSAATRFPFRAVDVAGIPWVEIDIPGDLQRARAHVWPAIASLHHPSGNGHSPIRGSLQSAPAKQRSSVA